MTSYEIIMIIIGVVGLLVAAITACVALKNLRLLVEMHRDNHEWNRRIETKKAISGIREINVDELNIELGYANQRTAIPLDTLLDLFKKNPRLQIICHQLLNFNEAIAAGVHTGVYSESVVKKARKGAMERDFAKFRDYILYRRDQISPTLFIEQEKLISKWTDEIVKSTDRKPTGQI